VLRAGQVGLVKVLSVQKFREGVRMEILCGKRAADYLSLTYDQAKAIGQQLSVKPQDTLAAVERMAAELAAVKSRAAELETAVFEAIAKENEGRGDVVLFQSAMKSDSVRRLADAVAKQSGGLACVFAGEDGQFSFALLRADGEDISATVKEMVDAILDDGAVVGRPAMGVTVYDLSDLGALISEDPSYPEDGMLVNSVAEGSDAEKQGLQVEDVIIEIDGKKAEDINVVRSAINKKQVGDTVTVKVWRAGETMELTIALIDQNDF
jgi:hypothetical protein